MGRSGETYNKKEVRKKKEKKKKAKAEKREAKKNKEKKSLDDMMAYVDENGVISSTPPDQEKEEVDKEDIEIGIPKKSEEEKQGNKLRKGRVSYFNDSKGYGFIRDLENSNSVFVHINDVLDDIKVGSIVSFKAEKGKRGPVAHQVKLYEE